MKKLGGRRGRLGLVALSVATVFAFLTAASSPPATSASEHAVSPAIGRIGAQPTFWGPQQLHPGSASFSCQSSPIDGSAGPRCYSPQQIQQAYGYSGLLASGVDGAGVTIVIVDAYSDPYLATDLQIQDSTFGLPAANVTTVAPQGVPAFDINNLDQAGWAAEITLDVLWAHAMAPAAKIVLVEAKSDQDADILAATKWAVDNNAGNILSQSFGESELCVDPSILSQQHALFEEAVAKGITLFASSGDSGASQFNCSQTAPTLSVGSPASDPNVTAVGGTTLDASDPTGTYLGETAWTEGTNGITCNAPDEADVNCSGGGYSTLYGRPSYQQTLVTGGSGRGVPDVSYNTGVNGGILTHCGVCNILGGYSATDPTVFLIFGGTSAGSPQWAALTADAEQMAGHPLGNINPLLYTLAAQPTSYASDFHDITTGNNRVVALGNLGYDAGTGWDPVTGLGTPNAANLLPVLQGPPTNTSLPVVSGQAAVTKSLTTTTGEWDGSPTGYAYQWQRCAKNGSNCEPIAGAASSTYTLSSADAGHTIKVLVSATNAGGTTAVLSAHTAAVIARPAIKKKPRIVGRLQVGRKLTARKGIWSGPPTSYRYHWLRCNAHGLSCKQIRGARYVHYRIRKSDLGHRLRVRVTAANAAGKTTVISSRSRVVK